MADGERHSDGSAGKRRIGGMRQAVQRIAANDDLPRAADRPEPLTLACGRYARLMLRLDPTRHLRLRQACASEGRAAEAILYDALDRYLAGAADMRGYRA